LMESIEEAPEGRSRERVSGNGRTGCEMLKS
jgi:hypothetical protein